MWNVWTVTMYTVNGRIIIAAGRSSSSHAALSCLAVVVWFIPWLLWVKLLKYKFRLFWCLYLHDFGSVYNSSWRPISQRRSITPARWHWRMCQAWGCIHTDTSTSPALYGFLYTSSGKHEFACISMLLQVYLGERYSITVPFTDIIWGNDIPSINVWGNSMPLDYIAGHCVLRQWQF